MMAAATGIGVTVMIASFRVSVDDWLAQLLRADVYVSLEGAGATLGASVLDDDVLSRLTAQPEIRAVTTARGARIGTAGEPARVVAYGLHREAFDGFQFLAGDGAAIWPDWEAPDTIIVTEPFAWHRQLAPGAALMLETARGPRPFTVRGVYRDYGSERGLIAMSSATYRKHFDDRAIDGIGVYAAAETAPAAVTRAIEAALPPELAIQTIDNAAIRTLSLEVFDRTFIVTGVLRNLALIIACAGMFSSLMALGFERTRLLAIYRALGLSAGELFTITVTESTLAGLAAGLIAVPTGIAMALGLIEVINVRSFGWSMGLSVPASALASVVGVTVLAALAAGIYPAWRAARVPVALALHGE
ncbi:MAG: ABC transporter permease, partial [Gammaproteobacteria bacterium]|nr:ABC transporter permease [Gammaproteobacteria bacterium]